jgi:hypothetical protein
MAFLGAEHLHLSYKDCIYRHSPTDDEWLYCSERAIFGELHPLEQDFPHTLADELCTLIGMPGDATLYAPLAIGHHVDHQIARQAGAILSRRRHDLCYYEDYPYVAKAGELEKALGASPGCWQAYLEGLSEEDMTAKLAAIGEYTSQLGVLFGDQTEMVRDTRRFYASLGDGKAYSERYWRTDVHEELVHGR